MDGSSWQNSGLTFDDHDPSRFVDQEEQSTLDVIGRDPMSIQWTDEKHRMYITSMEASFVEQLYSSKNSSGCHTRTKHNSDVKSRAPGQAKQLHIIDPPPEAHARDKHRRAKGRTDVASSSVQHKNYYMHQRAGEYNYFPTYCNEEVSDQNFAEGGFEPDRVSER